MRPELRRWAPSAALAFLAFALYAGTLRNGFVWDDHEFVLGNTFLHDWRNAAQLLTPDFFWQPRWDILGQARPVWLISAMADWALWGADAWGHHLTNVLLHAGAVCLLYGTLSFLGAPGAMPLWTALLFAAHPGNSEAVAVVSFREDILAALLVLAGWLAFKRTLGAEKGPKRAVWLAVSTAVYFLACLAKQSAAVLPALLFLYDLLVESAKDRRAAFGRWRLYLPFAAVLLYILWFNSWRFSYSDAGSWAAASSLEGVSSSESVKAFSSVSLRLGTGLRVLAGYLGQLLLPLRLCADYTLPATPLSDPAAIGAGALLLAALAAAWACRNRLPWAGFGLLWVLISFTPVANLIPIVNLRADRYLYLPGIGFCLAVAAALHALGDGRRRLAWGLAAALATAWGGRTLLRTLDWRDDRTVLEATLRCSPNSQRAHYNLGVILQQAGDFAGAERRFREAIRLNPERPGFYLNLGVCLEAQGRDLEAEAVYKEGVEREFYEPGRNQREIWRWAPAPSALRNNLANLYFRAGRWREAEPVYRAMLVADPEDTLARNNRGVCLTHLGRLKEAAAEFSGVLTRDPAHAQARRNLAEVRGALGAREPGR